MRIMAIGNQALMDGFALLGIETYADISISQLERILLDLRRQDERALVYLQQDLAQADIPVLTFLRNEGGQVLISEIPDILSADAYQASVDQLIARVMGKHILESFGPANTN